ncbi:MAG: hypothetical protein GVY06_07985 [Alphaproteobacteria bacterium]|jgi:hypothetical protein|nr:hypothetical protein [Alphaproteobacteria bacterium]
MPLTHALSRAARAAALAALIAAGAAPAALAQEQTAILNATCNIQGQASPMQMQYTRYRDAAVTQDRHGLNSEAIDMQQWGTTYWEGQINTPNGPYRLTGENNFIEAWPVGGVYSDMITLELTQTGPQTFTIRDFYNDGPPMACQITGP